MLEKSAYVIAESQHQLDAHTVIKSIDVDKHTEIHTVVNVWQD